MSTLAASSIDPRPHTSFKDISRKKHLEHVYLPFQLIFCNYGSLQMLLPLNCYLVSDLSRLTFPDEAFPKSDEKKIVTSTRVKISKTDLPLKAGMSVDDFLFLHPINSDGQRRSPLRTYRPHVVSVHVLDD
ncbi:hypothetical protein OESDEN_15593 [Oesophagostomum dentatum]|uniref:Uncharacterized protein n=1 Tax=Oesophagostomum dentatum TaxID=61180 RepID=A0A0B1SNE4_OESDE|nr:hypothetical protein OESDEN_15593 [Oesophagostomum dentatum]